VNRLICLCVLLMTGVLYAGFASSDQTPLWSAGKMPHPQANQSVPCLQWYVPPWKPNGACVILISGGGYNALTDGLLLNRWNEKLTERGFQCVSLKYRTPPTKQPGLPGYQAAWEDGQRAVRLVRSLAAERGFDPEKIGAMGMSAGAHLTALLAVNSTTNVYARVDAVDDLPCNVQFAITGAIAYGLNDERPAATSIELCDYWRFDRLTPPMCLLHGAKDGYSPRHSMAFDKVLKAKGIYSELHLFPDRPHGFWGDEMKPRAERAMHDRWWEIVESFLVKQKLCAPGVDDPKAPAASEKDRIDFKKGTLRLDKATDWPCRGFIYLLGGEYLVMTDCAFARKTRSICSGGKPVTWTATNTVCKLDLYGNQFGKQARLHFVDSDMRLCLDPPNCGGDVELKNTRLMLSGGVKRPVENFKSFSLAGPNVLLYIAGDLLLPQSFRFDFPKGGFAHPVPVRVAKGLSLPEGCVIAVDATKLAKGTYPLICAGALHLPDGDVAKLTLKAKCASGRKARLVREAETLKVVIE